MGACDFYKLVSGKTAQEAFNKAVTDAQYDSGHGGYTGTIAEKSTFVMISNPVCSTKEAAYELAQKLINEDDRRVSDKWGPAGCIPIAGTDKFVFFGWASS